MKRVFCVILVLFLGSFIIFNIGNNANVVLDEVLLEDSSSNSSMFAIMVENDSGEYEEYTDSDSFPTDMYYNDTLSGCIDGDGNTVDGILFYNYTTSVAIVNTSETSYCYLYFDLSLDWDCVEEGITSLSECILRSDNYTSSVTNAVNFINLKGTPDFSETATTDEGLYAAEDDYGTSYYFRGAVEDNYVYFAGFYWRIIRINGDGSVRLIYDGTEPHENGDSDTDRTIGTSPFHSIVNSSIYVGYMFSSNASSSVIKLAIDDWFEEAIFNNTDGTNSYSEYLSDTLFCNDRTYTDASGTGYTQYIYGANTRISSNSPSFVCPELDDSFTTDDTIYGNGALTYPTALITIDEVVMAGGISSNSDYYLYIGNAYWTMSPMIFTPNPYATIGIVSSTGGYSSYPVAESNYYIRPVISLSPSVVVTSGDGTYDSPYEVALS